MDFTPGGEKICIYWGRLPSKCDGTNGKKKECSMKDKCIAGNEAKTKRDEAIKDNYYDNFYPVA